MMRILGRLYRDETGAVSPMALILVVTLLALGATVGLTSLRDQLVQEFGDTAQALENIDQSFSVSTTSFYGDGTAPASCLAVDLTP